MLIKLKHRTTVLPGTAGRAPAAGSGRTGRAPQATGPGGLHAAAPHLRRPTRPAADLVPGPSPSGCPTLARLEREARTILERLQRLDAADGPTTRWSPEGVEGLLQLLADFHRRLETLVRLDHDPAALPEVLATRRWIAQAQLVVVGRLTDLYGD